MFAETKDVFCPYCGAIATRGEVCTHTPVDSERYGTSATYSFHGENKTGNAAANRNSNPNANSNANSNANRRAFTGGAPQKRTGTKISGGALTFLIIIAVAVIATIYAALSDANDSFGNTPVVSSFPVTKCCDMLVTNSQIKANAYEGDGVCGIDIEISKAFFGESSDEEYSEVADADDAISAICDGSAQCVVTVLNDSAIEGFGSFYSMPLHFAPVSYGVLSTVDNKLPCERYLLISDFSIENMDCEIKTSFPFNAFKISKDGVVTYCNLTKTETGEYIVAEAAPLGAPPESYIDFIEF